MANFFKDYTKKSVEKLALTEADKDLLKIKNEGSTHDPKPFRSLKRTRNETRRFAMFA